MTYLGNYIVLNYVETVIWEMASGQKNILHPAAQFPDALPPLSEHSVEV